MNTCERGGSGNFPAFAGNLDILHIQESSLLTVDFLTERYMTGLQNHFINLKFKNRLIISRGLLGKMIDKTPRRTFAKWAKWAK